MGEVITIEKTVSAFGRWLLEETASRNLSLLQLAAQAKIGAATLYKIINTPEAEPKLATMYALSQALNIPLWRVIEACGYDVGIEKAA